jgi:general secretion pathway protein G
MHSFNFFKQFAFTLLELMIAIVIAAILIGVAVPSYQDHLEGAKQGTAIKDIGVLSLKIEQYRNIAGTFPASLSDLNITLPTDPWGHAYQYLAIDIVPPPNTGHLRRDKNLIPLNSDFDLYSMGADGDTQTQLTASKARDDIVRAGNGSYVGLAADH